MFQLKCCVCGHWHEPIRWDDPNPWEGSGPRKHGPPTPRATGRRLGQAAESKDHQSKEPS
jgi:hypothetical protein